MSTEIRFRRGSTAEHFTFTGAAGEVTVDTTKDVVVVHDGVTAGGIPSAREDHTHTGVYEPADATILKDADIGVTVQAYDADIPTVAASQVEMETGTETALRSMSPLRVAQAITALSGGGGGSNKNKIIGGDFTTNPWQRGTTFTALANSEYSADRWLMYNNTTGVVDVLKTTDAPTPVQADVFSQHCFHLDVTTADASIAAGDLLRIVQRVEGINAVSFGFGQAGTRYVTLSFWHKHTKVGTYCVSFTNSAADRSYVAEYTQAVTDTWEKATVTIPVDTAGTWLYGSGVGLQVNFAVAAGSTYQTAAGAWAAGNFHATANQVNALDSVSNNFKIALVQLEAGSVATPFEALDFGTVIRQCQRYYWRWTPTVSERFGAGHNLSTTVATCVIRFPVTMRAAPTGLEQSGTASHYSIAHLASSTVCSAVPTFGAAGINSAVLSFTVASGLTAGQGSECYANNTAGYLGFSTEL